MDRLKRVLLRIQELDLAGQIEDVEEVVKGFGGSCEVYQGKCTRLQKLVAIKRFRLFLQKEQKFAEKLTLEIYIWSKLNHPNVLPFLGFYLEESGFPNLVSEWMENGTLFDYLPMLPRGIAALDMLVGIAEGLSYLHSMKVIHADLKSTNVLISQEGTPLLADFGVSRTLSSTLTMPGMTTSGYSPRGTVRWMAIELLSLADGTETLTHTEQADVWAFGMVAYEILARQVPFSHLKSDLHVMLAITKGELPARPDAIDDVDASRILVEDGLWQICERCWKPEPSARPSMNELLDSTPTQTASVSQSMRGVTSEYMFSNLSVGGDGHEGSGVSKLPLLESMITFPRNDSRGSDANFECSIPGCSSVFTKYFTLKEHLRSHNVGKQFKCAWPGCEKHFAHVHDRDRHEQVHLNMIPYVCKGCQRTFARMDSLNRHRQSDAGAGCRARQPLLVIDQPDIMQLLKIDDLLRGWLFHHQDHPYPSEEEKKQLCKVTGLNTHQISSWVINAHNFLASGKQVGAGGQANGLFHSATGERLG